MVVVVELVIFLGAIGMAIQSLDYLTTPIATSPGILPLIVSLAAAAVAGMLLALELARGDVSVARLREAARSREFRLTAARAAGWLSLATAYAVATPILGFSWATVIFLAIALSAFARLAWWRTALIAIAMAMLIPLAFRYLFFTIIP